jgi:hypothetical protein
VITDFLKIIGFFAIFASELNVLRVNLAGANGLVLLV